MRQVVQHTISVLLVAAVLAAEYHIHLKLLILIANSAPCKLRCAPFALASPRKLRCAALPRRLAEFAPVAGRLLWAIRAITALRKAALEGIRAKLSLRTADSGFSQVTIFFTVISIIFGNYPVDKLSLLVYNKYRYVISI